MDRFHEYLYGGQFEVYTDNNPLTYILTSAKLDAMGQRWVASLANYDFRIFYTSKHKIADKWESEPYEIVSQHSDGLPVYTVKRNDRGRTLHCNMLFPLGL